MKIQKREAVMFLIIIILSLVIWDNRTIIFGNNSAEVKNTTEVKKEGISQGENIYDVVRVVDGDTLIINIDGEDERVRLTGLNTPEAKEINGRVVECFGEKASQQAAEILNGQKVLFEGDEKTTRDQYGRLLGYVFLVDESGEYTINFSELMIESGYGYEYTYQGRRYKYQPDFKTAQKNAENQKVGLWEGGVCAK